MLRAIAGEPASFFIRAHDVLGRPKVMGGEAFDAFAVCVDEELNGGSAAHSPVLLERGRGPLVAPLSPDCKHRRRISRHRIRRHHKRITRIY